MKKAICILALSLAAAFTLPAQNVPSKIAQRTVADTLSARLKRRDSVDAPLKINKVISTGGKTYLRFTSALGDHPWTEKDVTWFMDQLQKEWKKYGGGTVDSVFSASLNIKELISPALTYGGGATAFKYTDREADHRSPSGRFIRMTGAKNFSKGLSDRYIALWQSHGRYYSEKDSLWQWQRATMFRTVEDMYTQSYVLPFLIPMLENAGAFVMTPRERDTQKLEVVMDNDPAFADERTGLMRTSGKYSESGDWSSAGTGFADAKAVYSMDDNPFLMGTSRMTGCSGENPDATVRWTPVVKERGRYAVYISYKTLSKSTTDAHYTVNHMGGSTEFLVNQRRGGGTWIYLGTFEFDEGSDGSITLDNRGKQGAVVTADAVRIGGGMGKVERGGTLSGMPAYMEGAMYSMKWAGTDNSIYKEEWETDYTKDYAGRGAWTAMLKDEKNIPFDMSFAFHSDAGVTPNDSTVGTLAIYTLLCDKERKYKDGRDRMIARTYAKYVQDQVVEDIRSDFDPKWSRRRLWDKSYSECRTTEVPGMILELLSHQNFADMKYGLDPTFRFTVCRAVYKGMLKAMSEFYGCPYEVQPLPVNSFAVTFSEEPGKASLRWKATEDRKEPTAVPKGYTVYTRVDDGVFDQGVDVSDTGMEVDIEPGHIYSFKVEAFNDGGRSFPSEILAIGEPGGRLAKEKAPVLIVNNFDRLSAPDFTDRPDYAGFNGKLDSGVPYISDISFIGEMYQFDRTAEYVDDYNPGFGASYTDNAGEIIAGNTFDYPYVHGKAFFDLGLSFCSSSRDAFTAAPDTTASVLDIICGKQKTVTPGRGAVADRFRVFPSDFQKAIETYAAKGGSILVSGSKFATDAQSHHDSQQFLRTILGVKLVNSYGTSSGRIGDYAFHDKPNQDVYCVECVDAIAPADKNGRVILRYPVNNSPAAVSFYTDQYRTVCIGVPVETVKSDKDRKDLVRKSLQELQILLP